MRPLKCAEADWEAIAEAQHPQIAVMPAKCPIAVTFVAKIAQARTLSIAIATNQYINFNSVHEGVRSRRLRSTAETREQFTCFVPSSDNQHRIVAGMAGSATNITTILSSRPGPDGRE